MSRNLYTKSKYALVMLTITALFCGTIFISPQVEASASREAKLVQIQQLLELIATLQKQLALKDGNTNTSVRSVSSLSPWGDVLVKDVSAIPTGKFKAMWVNKNTLAQRLPAETVDQIYFDYITYATAVKHHGKNLGAYWVGNFDLKAGKPVYFDFSDPQQDKVRLYIDGKMVHDTAGLYIHIPKKTKRSIIEVLYESNWHAGTFSVGHNLVTDKYETDQKGLEQQDAIEDIADFLKDNPRAVVRAAAVYEAENQENGKVSVQLPTASDTSVLVLGSYDPVSWEIVRANKALKKVYVLSFAGASKVAVSGASPDIIFVRRAFLEADDESQLKTTVADELKIPIAIVKETKYKSSAMTLVF